MLRENLKEYKHTYIYVINAINLLLIVCFCVYFKECRCLNSFLIDVIVVKNVQKNIIQNILHKVITETVMLL